jgi:hypothetical protein
MKHAMYGVSLTAMRERMPVELAKIQAGDIVFISEKEISDMAVLVNRKKYPITLALKV